jgi:hypothetical protein
MKIPDEAIIPVEKLTAYLLVTRPRDDKSRFLAQAGFHQNDPDALLVALRRLAAAVEAVEDGVNEYGTFYRVEGELTGPTGHSLRVVTIWLRWSLDGSMHFVTLKPLREGRA